MIIGLAGPANSGKTTVSNIILQKFKDFSEDAFALGVKNIVCDLFSVNHEFIEKYKRIQENAPNLNMPMRNILQFVGDGMKNIKSDVWIQSLLHRIEDKQNVIISDVRYMDEMEALKKIGAVIILIGREETVDNHPSEILTTELVNLYLKKTPLTSESKMNASKMIDHFIRNDDTFLDLEKKVTDIVSIYI